MEIVVSYIDLLIFIFDRCFNNYYHAIPSVIDGSRVGIITFIVHIILGNPLFVLAIGMWVFYELNVLLKSIIHINS